MTAIIKLFYLSTFLCSLTILYISILDHDSLRQRDFPFLIITSSSPLPSYKQPLLPITLSSSLHLPLSLGPSCELLLPSPTLPSFLPKDYSEKSSRALVYRALMFLNYRHERRLAILD